jgi:prepilin-type processing-associated H-X9-DG protein
LIELLVVVAIIAVLVSILLPAMAGARSKAKIVVCQANIKQLDHALSMYSQEYDDWVPHRHWSGGLVQAGWSLYIAKYLGLPTYNTAVAPTANWNSYPQSTVFACPEGGEGVYQLNTDYAGSIAPQVGLHHRSQEAYPQWTMRLGERGPGDWVLNAGMCNYGNIARMMQLLAVRHHGGGNFLFGDGHIEWLPGDPFQYVWSWRSGFHRIFSCE